MWATPNSGKALHARADSWAAPRAGRPAGVGETPLQGGARAQGPVPPCRRGSSRRPALPQTHSNPAPRLIACVCVCVCVCARARARVCAPCPVLRSSGLWLVVQTRRHAAVRASVTVAGGPPWLVLPYSGRRGGARLRPAGGAVPAARAAPRVWGWWQERKREAHGRRQPQRVGARRAGGCEKNRAGASGLPAPHAAGAQQRVRVPRGVHGGRVRAVLKEHFRSHVPTGVRHVCELQRARAMRRAGRGLLLLPRLARRSV